MRFQGIDKVAWAAVAILLIALVIGATVKQVGAWSGPTIGDANCDNLVNSADAAIALQFGAGLRVEHPACTVLADVNVDMQLDAVDAELILQWDACVISYLPGAYAPDNHCYVAPPSVTPSYLVP